MEQNLIVLNYLRERSRRRRQNEENRRRIMTFFAQEQRQFLELIALLLNVMGDFCNVSWPRQIWVKHRSQRWWTDIVCRTWNSYDFKSNFRVTQQTFEMVVQEIRPYFRFRRTRMRSPLTPEMRLGITLWRLSTNVDLRTLSCLFGIGVSTVHLVVNQVVTIICRYLTPKYIKMPTSENAQDIVNGYLDVWGFPQCFGAIDGTHIPIKKPTENPVDYYCRKQFYSVVMQAVVNHKYCFTHLIVGWPGSVHDARVFSNSILRHGPLPDLPTMIAGLSIPCFLIGDGAYPLLPTLMKPFPYNGFLTPQQKLFNEKLSKARMTVENAFGRLKGRWRFLLKQSSINVKDVCKIAIASGTLHNICELHNDVIFPEWLESPESELVDYADNNNHPITATAQEIRHHLSRYFWSQRQIQ